MLLKFLSVFANLLSQLDFLRGGKTVKGGGGDEGRSNYSILGCVQLCGVSLPPLSFLISFIGLYWELSVSQHEGRVDRKIDKAHTRVDMLHTLHHTVPLSRSHATTKRKEQ